MKGFVYRHSTAHAHARAMVSLTNANGSLSEDGKCVVYYLYSKGMDRLVAAIERLYPEEVLEVSEYPIHLQAPAAAWIVKSLITDGFGTEYAVSLSDLIDESENEAYTDLLINMRNSGWTAWRLLEREMNAAKMYHDENLT